MEKLLKLDPTNTELLAQKQRLLGDAIKETKDKLDSLKTAASQANEQLQKGDITQAAKTNTTLLKIDEVGGKLKDVGDKVSGVGTALMPVFAGVTALGTAAVKMTSDFDSGMSRVAAISGATDEELAKLRQIAKDLGASTETLAISVGEIMVPVIREIVAKLQEFMDKLNALDPADLPQ